VEEGNAPAVGDGTPDGQATPSNDPAKRASSTTQEAEKALEDDYDRLLAEVRSLRTQHTELIEERDAWKASSIANVNIATEYQQQVTKDQERIEELERVLANLGVQLTAGGSGDPAGGEVE